MSAAAASCRVSSDPRDGEILDPEDVFAFPDGVPGVTVDDDATQVRESKRGQFAITYRGTDGLTVRALTAHFKSKLNYYGRNQFDTKDDAKRVRFQLYALAQRAADAQPPNQDDTLP